METIELQIIFELMTINTNKVYAVTHFILIALVIHFPAEHVAVLDACLIIMVGVSIDSGNM